MATDHEHDEEEEQESIDSLFTSWDRHISHLRRTGDEVRSLHAQLTPWHGAGRRAADWNWIVEAFRRAAASARKSEFESLIFQTTALHHRGTDVLNPDRGPRPIPSPFVRRMPDDQAEVEAKRYQRNGLHVIAYQEHIRQCLDHFVWAWTALIDGCSNCDWEMIDDEFPKLALLAEESQRAFNIWSSVDR